MSKPIQIIKYLWALPVTLFGLVLVLLALLTGGRARVVQGVLEAHGGIARFLLRRLSGAATTLGHVILARDQGSLDQSRAHERVHVRQFERWGVFLLPVYWLIQGWLLCRGLDPYLDHPFEREAAERANKGG